MKLEIKVEDLIEYIFDPKELTYQILVKTKYGTTYFVLSKKEAYEFLRELAKNED